MSAPKWTSGEWSAQMVGRPLNDPSIPTMWWLRYGAVSISTDNPADVALCAAAPDLYAALDECVAELLDVTGARMWSDVSPITERAFAALRKARGENADNRRERG